MDRFVLFALGGLARVLSAVLNYYADWVLQRLVDGFDGTWDFAHDLWHFARALITALAERLAGHAGRGLRMDEDWQPEYYAR